MNIFNYFKFLNLTLCHTNPTTSSCSVYLTKNNSYAEMNYTDMITLPNLTLVQGYNFFNTTTIGNIIVTNDYMPILMSGSNQLLSIPIDFSAGAVYNDFTFLDLDTSTKRIVSAKTAYTKGARYYVKIKYAGYFDSGSIQYTYSTPGKYNLLAYVKSPTFSTSITMNVLGQYNTTIAASTQSSSTTAVNFGATLSSKNDTTLGYQGEEL